MILFISYSKYQYCAAGQDFHHHWVFTMKEAHGTASGYRLYIRRVGNPRDWRWRVIHGLTRKTLERPEP